jgi:hypothetical protein
MNPLPPDTPGLTRQGRHVLTLSHYLWAGLDFILPADGPPVLLEANKSSHMLGEYLRFHDDEAPFERVARRMNEADGPPVILWRRSDPQPDADEDITFITRHLAPYLAEPPRLANVEDNADESVPPTEQPATILCRDGQRVRPGSLFRWWYGCPWRFERNGVLVINPNALWVACRDKLDGAAHLAGSSQVRSPWCTAVDSTEEIEVWLESEPARFANGYVVKPRSGWGGYGVQVAGPGEAPRRIGPGYLLSERVFPIPRPGSRNAGEYWDIRAFVMDGQFVGGLVHVSQEPNTNYWQGGRVEALDPGVARRIAPAAEEAVRRIDQAAANIHRGPAQVGHPSTVVRYD